MKRSGKFEPDALAVLLLVLWALFGRDLAPAPVPNTAGMQMIRVPLPGLHHLHLPTLTFHLGR